MSWPQEMAVGAALAATLADDGALDIAGSGLWPDAAETARALHSELSDVSDRRAALRALARRVRPTPSVHAALPPRGRAVIAARVPKEVGRVWLSDAPPVRRGYRPATGLIETTVRGAEEVHVPDVDTVPPSDRGVGRALLAACARGAAGVERERLLAGIGAAEAAAVLALTALEDETTEPPRVFLDAASLAPGDARVDALGALTRGAREPRERNRADSFARAGRELMEFGLVKGS